jgi:hypothetical protein
MAQAQTFAITDLLGGQIKKCKIQRFNSDNAISISRCANAGAMRLANLRPTRRWKAGRVPRKSGCNPNLMTISWPAARIARPFGRIKSVRRRRCVRRERVRPACENLRPDRRVTSGSCCETRFGAVSTAHWPAATNASNARN